MRNVLLIAVLSLLLHVKTIGQEMEAKNCISATHRIGEPGSNSLFYHRIIIQRPVWKVSTGIGFSLIGRRSAVPRAEWTFLPAVPLEGTVLVGKRNHYLEAGLGLVPGVYPFRNPLAGKMPDQDTFLNRFSWPGIAILGYRYQSNHSGFFLRAGLTPKIFEFNSRFTYFGISPGASLSLGISF